MEDYISFSDRLKKTLPYIFTFFGGTLTTFGLLAGFFYFAFVRNIDRTFLPASQGAETPPALSNKIESVKKEGDGLINVLVLGFDAYHSDSIMVASINPETGHTSMISLPRDMWVPSVTELGHGVKINNIFLEVEQKKGDGRAVMKRVIGEVLDMNIHYYVSFDWSGFIRFVDAIGGVTVDVPYQLRDYSNDINIKAGVQKLDGNSALKFVRCRKNTCRRDFGRQERQQIMVRAVGEVLVKKGFHLSPIKIFKIMDALGKHLRTDISRDEILNLIDLAQKINLTKIETKVLGDGYGQPFRQGRQDPYGTVLKTRTGDFSELRRLVHEMLEDPKLKQEHAKIEVRDATKNASSFTILVQKLKSYVYTILGKKKNPEYEKTSKIFDYSEGKKPYTIKYLELRFGTKAVSMPKPAGTKANILLIIGNADLTSE